MTKKNRRNNKVSFHLNLDRDEYDLYHAWAQSRGVTLEDWIKGLLGQAIPRQVRADQKRLDNGSGRAALEQAYAAMDNEDAAVLGLPPPHSPPEPTEVSVAEPNTKHLPILSMSQAHTMGHPCVHLVREFSGTFTERDASGTCKKLQKICFWGAQGAKNCLDFRAKSQLRPPPPPGR